MTPKKKLFYADLIRVLAVFMVMIIHASAPLLAAWGKETPDYWMWGNGFDSVVRACVPLFVMLSGALILGRQEPLGDFFSKRFSRLLLPFVIWVAVFINWRIFYIGEVLPPDKIILMVLKGPVYYHLWYLYMVMGLYLITPFLRHLLAVVQKGELKYLLGLWFIFNSVLPLVLYMVYLYAGYSAQFGIAVPSVMGYTGYYVLGWWLRQRDFKSSSIPLWWVVYGVNTALTFFGTLAFSTAAKTFQWQMYDYFSPTVALQALSLFILLHHYGNRWEHKIPERIKKRFASIGKLSLGMYLIHVIFLELMGSGVLGFKLNGSAFYPAFAVPVTAACAFVLSYGSMLLISKIPVLKYAVVEHPGRRAKGTVQTK